MNTGSESKQERLGEIAERMEELIAEERKLSNEAVGIVSWLRRRNELKTGVRPILGTFTLGPVEIIIRSQNWQRTIRFEGHRMDKMVGWTTDMLKSLRYGYEPDVDAHDVNIISRASYDALLDEMARERADEADAG